jgi:hypothetical protein
MRPTDSVHIQAIGFFPESLHIVPIRIGDPASRANPWRSASPGVFGGRIWSVLDTTDPQLEFVPTRRVSSLPAFIGWRPYFKLQYEKTPFMLMRRCYMVSRTTLFCSGVNSSTNRRNATRFAISIWLRPLAAGGARKPMISRLPTLAGHTTAAARNAGK